MPVQNTSNAQCNSHFASKIIVAKYSLMQALVRHRPTPRTSSFAAEQRFWR